MTMRDFGFDQNEEIEDLLQLEVVQFGIPRQIYQRNNYYDTMDDVNFRRRFRLSRRCTLQVLELIDEQLEFTYDMNNSVSSMNQLLLCLRLYSTGGHLQSVADFHGVHLATASRIVNKVSEVLARLYNQFIQFGADVNSLRRRQQHFYNIAAFPRVIGAIDCTYVKTQSPGGRR